jgi:hypothetical protein
MLFAKNWEERMFEQTLKAVGESIGPQDILL